MGKFVINGATEVNSGVGTAIISGASFVSKLITNDGMWERGHYFNINDTTVGEIGMYGKGETVYHAFIGSTNTSTWMKVEPNGTVTATKFVGSLQGNADTASKWKTARNIQIQDHYGAYSASTAVSVDGSANKILKLPQDIKCRILDTNLIRALAYSSSSGAGYYKIATLTKNVGSYQINNSLMLAVSGYYGYTYNVNGILKADIRWEVGSTAPAHISLKWITAQSGIDPEQFMITHSIDSNNIATCDIFVYLSESYRSINFTKISEHSWGGYGAFEWQLLASQGTENRFTAIPEDKTIKYSTIVGLDNLSSSSNKLVLQEKITSIASADAYLHSGLSYFHAGKSATTLDNDGNIIAILGDTGWGSQLWIDDGSGKGGLAVRSRKNTTTWNDWIKILDSNNYSSYALPLSGGTLTGRLTTTGLTISSTSADKHIEFLRGSANYFTAPSAGYFAFLPNGKTLTISNCDCIIDDGEIYPGTDNYTSLGTSSRRWSTIYCANRISISGATDNVMDSSTTNPRITFSENGSQPVALVYTDYDIYRSPAGLKVLGTSTDASPAWFEVEGNIYGSKVYGAVWNDYAEFRSQDEEIKPGYCVTSSKSGKVYKTVERLQYCEGIVSDTYGFSIGETDGCKTPLAVSGRVLAYYDGDINDYHIGDVVCATKNGLIIKMTREEIKEYPDRIVGTVSEIPSYDTWGSGNVPTTGRIWIKVR